MTPDQLDIINASRTANVLMNELKPYLDKKRADIIAQIKMMARGEEHSLAKFLSCATSLCTLDDLENQLSQAFRAGEKISKEKYDADARRE